jgi:hypothetical protein
MMDRFISCHPERSVAESKDLRLRFNLPAEIVQ